MKCESCRDETDERVKVRSNGWNLWVCMACQQSLGRGKGKGKKGGKK